MYTLLVTLLSALLQITNTADIDMGQLVGGITDSATTLFPWWQVAVVCALIIGFGIRFVPRIIKRMG